MKRWDKLRHIERVNYLAEQRYLHDKVVLNETSSRGHNGMEPFMEINHDGTFTNENVKPEPSKGDWVFERSSGFAGYRCQRCATWLYDNQKLVCKCDA
jgi:hypothetical protein